MDNIEKKLDDIIERQMEYMEQCGQIHEKIASLTTDVHEFKAFADDVKKYYIDRQEHYRQHQWLSEMMGYTEQCKSVVIKAVLGAVVAGLLAILWIGFSLKVKG